MVVAHVLQVVSDISGSKYSKNLSYRNMLQVFAIMRVLCSCRPCRAVLLALVVCTVHARPMPTEMNTPACSSTVSEFASAMFRDEAQGRRSDEPMYVAANVHPKNPGVGGVIDRPIPKAGTPGAPNDASLTQFNRVPDATLTTVTTPMSGLSAPAALPDSDGGRALYTILERPAGSVQQVRPVGFTEPHARPATATSTPKRYCTVNEVLRSTAQNCR